MTDGERGAECGDVETHSAHNFQAGGPEDGDYCYGVPALSDAERPIPALDFREIR